VLLREFPPEAASLAQRELQAYALLDASFANRSAAVEPPLAPLLGAFSAQSVGAPASSYAASTFLVTRWDAPPRPWALHASREQPQRNALVRTFAPDAARRDRARFVAAAAAGAADALAFCHAKGVAHNALDGAACLLSADEDSAWESLTVRLTNFGYSYAREATAAGPESEEEAERAWAEACEADVRAWGRTLAEAVFSALSTEGATERTEGLALERLFSLLFEGEAEAMREYCQAEEAWAPAVEALDAGGGRGWYLLSAVFTPAPPPPINALAQEALKWRDSL